MKLEKKLIRQQYEITMPEGICQKKLADILGVTPQTVWNWKKAKRIPARYAVIMESLSEESVKK